MPVQRKWLRWCREYRLKPWDVCAGVLIATEAGATVTTMEGGDFSVFDRSILAATPLLHAVRQNCALPIYQLVPHSHRSYLYMM